MSLLMQKSLLISLFSASLCFSPLVVAEQGATRLVSTTKQSVKSKQLNIQDISPSLPAKHSLVRLTYSSAVQGAAVSASNNPLVLSWVQDNGQQQSLHYQTWHAGQWTKSVEISQGKNWFLNWADFPSVIQDGERVAAHSLRKSGAGTYDYDVWLSLANQTGKIRPDWLAHTDGVQAEHGFATLLWLPNKHLFATWLDGRNTKKTASDDEHAHASGMMTLRAATFNAQGQPEQAWQLDASACDCCQTAAAITRNGPVVAYRNRTEHEYRDIYLTRWLKDKWTEPVPIANDGWQIAGCPVNGPALAAQGDQLAAAWFTAAQEQAQVKLAFSQNAGQHFSAPIVVAAANPEQPVLGRVGVAMLNNGITAITWLQAKAQQQAQLTLALYDSRGQLLQTAPLAQLSSSRKTGVPSLVSDGQHFYVSYFDLAEQRSFIKKISLK